MNLAQKQYELGFNLLMNSQRFNTTNYFRSIDTIKSRQNQYLSPRRFIIKKNLQEPFKDFFVMKSNEKFRIKIDAIQNKPVIPKLNTEYIELEQRIHNNKEKTRQLYLRAISLENEKFAKRIFAQRPRVLDTKLLEKLYKENHEKYIDILKSGNKRRLNFNGNDNTIPVRLPKIISKIDSKYKIHSKTEANLDSDNEQNDNNNSLELKDHEHKEISHQKQGHIEGQHREINNNLAETSG